jgi:hypothetical protein
MLILGQIAGLPPVPTNLSVTDRRRGRTVVVEWFAEPQEPSIFGSPVLFLLEERHHVGRHFSAARLSSWVARHRSSRTNVTLKNLLRPGHWYQFRVAAVSANGTRGFSEPSLPFTLSVGMTIAFGYLTIPMLNCDALVSTAPRLPGGRARV